MSESSNIPPESIEVVLTSVRMAARDTNLYTFERPDRGPLPGAEPGSHIGVILANGIERQYSLLHAGPELSEYTVGVKRDANSRGGSLYMHDQLRVGSKIFIVPPRNNFPLKEDAQMVVLLAGGIGITPIYCMVKRLIAKTRPWALYYSCRSRMDAAFFGELSQYQEAHFHFDDEEEGRFLNVAAIVENLPKHAHLYCCGPAPMLAGFEAATAHWPPEQIHVEYFTPKFAAAQGGGYVVELARSKRELTIPPGKSILQAVREAGIQVPHSCEEGVCGACETRVISGIPDHRDTILTEQERKESATMMICCSGSKSPRLVLDI
ncbi:MAG TPA: PDR/VanB family oxidoreductase [Micropepsaceae bacterium]|nr:PDR/VanB family oxidoreductase [Micropepsaceae bacterium]